MRSVFSNSALQLKASQVSSVVIVLRTILRVLIKFTEANSEKTVIA